MAGKSRATLKTYYNTADNPTQQQMYNLVDSMKLDTEEEEVTCHVSSAISSSDSIGMFVADRAITITYIACFGTGSPSMSYKLRKNTASTLADLTGTISSHYDPTDGSSFPTETITTSAVASGDIVFLTLSAYSSGAPLTWIVRYK